MIEPTLALQTAIRAALIASSAVNSLVDPDHIRSGSTRPDITPCIHMTNATVALYGHDYTAQRAAWVNLDLHVWALDAGQDAAKDIAFAVLQVLNKKKVHVADGHCDHFRVTNVIYLRDPDPSCGHGVMSVEALIRWIV